MKKEFFERIHNAQKNLIIEGDMFSGKTTNVLFPIIDNIIGKRESLFILDSKEEYISNYYEKLKENDYNVIILNLRDMDKSDGWNPLEYPYNLFKKGEKDKAQEYIEKIGQVIFWEKFTQDPFWTSTASDFFTGVSLALFEDAKEDEINLNSIDYMFRGIDKRNGNVDYLTDYFETKDILSKPYVFASSTFLAPKETRESILSVAKQKLRLYVSREKLSQIMNKTTFKFEDVVNKPTAIFLIAKDENTSLNAIAAVFIEQLYAILVDLKIKNKFNFVLDNFDVIEECNDLVDILGSCLSRNIKVYLATRSEFEIENIYGSYISKLCDLVSIENSKVKLVVNQVEESFDKDFETVVIKKCNIDYPKLKNETVKVFNLEMFVHNMYNGNLNNPFIDNQVNNDDLLKQIDDKLEELNLTFPNDN